MLHPTGEGKTPVPPEARRMTIRRMYIADNLAVLRGMNTGTVDLIYLDPPFNSHADYAAPIGSAAEGAGFKDTWTLDDLDREWVEDIQVADGRIWAACVAAQQIAGDSMMSYIVYMAVRLLEMRRVLKPTGSLWLHCDSTASHYLKMLLDAVFGQSRFRNGVVWRRHGGRPKGSQHKPRKLGRDTDTLFNYTTSDDFTWHGPHRQLTEAETVAKFPHTDERGRYHTKLEIFRQPSMGARPNLCYTYPSPHGPVTNPHPTGWRIKRERLAEMDARNEIIWREGKRPLRKSYAANYRGTPIGTLWDDIEHVSGSEDIGYPTQKPLTLLDRIIRASSNPGDLVLDPFAGQATLCVAAEGLDRQWIGIDIAAQAEQIIVDRLQHAADDGALLRTCGHGLPNIELLTQPPTRTDTDTPLRSRNIREMLYRKQEGTCPGCAEVLPIRYFTIEHIRPRPKRGADPDVDVDADDNLQLLCGPCSSVKGNRTMAYLLERA